jgi:putative ABC transport system substrate-binding protein
MTPARTPLRSSRRRPAPVAGSDSGCVATARAAQRGLAAPRGMTRRDLIALLAGAGAWPIGARGETRTLPVVGFFSSRSPEDFTHFVAAFRQGLHDEGYVEGQNVAVEYRWALGHYERLPALAAELAALQVAVIVATGGEPAALAAKTATARIPIVFGVGGDPVGLGLVADLRRPGGNATGVSLLTATLEAKRLELLHELVPSAAAIAVLINPDFAQHEAQAREVEEAARTTGNSIVIVNARSDGELEASFSLIAQQQARGLLVASDPFFDTRRERIIAFAAEKRLPAIYQFRDYPVAGGLMSYGIKLTDAYYQFGVYTGRILKGASPADLPVVQSRQFELVINLKTAQALDLAVPPALLARADEVIE